MDISAGDHSFGVVVVEGTLGEAEVQILTRENLRTRELEN
jgi:hypothetical protein